MDTKRVRKNVPDHPGKDKQENRDTKKRPVTGPTAIALLSKKGSVEAENCSELNMHRAEILRAPAKWETQDSIFWSLVQVSFSVF